ncbi:MAG: S-methyl-5'-thioadenosine phosphorylase [Thermodesulfobacteriota bacterium]
MVKLGIIGGSGLDDPAVLANGEILRVDTPYGEPSSAVIQGTINGTPVALISRHGNGHKLSPTQVNYRANIHALTDVGVTHIVATTACGSLRQEIGRGDFVVPDQFIDFTRARSNTFFDSFHNGARHCSMADPFDEVLRRALIETARDLGFTAHERGTVITIEGPRFSTRAESHMFRALGGDIINMSIAPEAALANEAGVPYAAIAMSTDYDCWKTDEEPASWDDILEVFHRNASNMKEILLRVGTRINRG